MVLGCFKNVPLVLNTWQPGIWLEKTEPSSIPIWVYVYNILMELCNGNGIGNIMSGVGKLMVMDKMTRERCLKKAGKLDFARVLVEVNANEDLHSVLEIEYPPLGNRKTRVGKLEVKYQWKPPLCTHCKTFGHSILACKVRPRTVEEVAAKNVSLDNNVDKGSKSNDKGKSQVDDGFVIVEKNNKLVVAASSKKEGVQNRNSQGRFGQSSFSRNSDNKKSNSFGGYGMGGNVRSGNGVYQVRFQPKPKNNSGVSKMANQGDDSHVKNPGSKDKLVSNSTKDHSKPVNMPQSLLDLSKDPNYKPKVLIRGSNSKHTSDIAINESIPINNSYQVLEDVDMEQGTIEKDVSKKEEFFNSVWPGLKEEGDILLEAGIYPYKAVRLDWDIHQLDYFYKNCHKFQLDPSFEDDDVESEKDGIASEMKSEYDPVSACDKSNNTALPPSVFNGVKPLLGMLWV